MYGSHADPSLLQLDALADCSRKLSVFVIRQLTLFFLNFSQSYELGNKSETVNGNCDRVGRSGGCGLWILGVPVLVVTVETWELLHWSKHVQTPNMSKPIQSRGKLHKRKWFFAEYSSGLQRQKTFQVRVLQNKWS